MEFVFGRKGFYAVSIFMFVFAYGCMIAYMLLLYHSIQKVKPLDFLLYNDELYYYYYFSLDDTIPVFPFSYSYNTKISS